MKPTQTTEIRRTLNRLRAIHRADCANCPFSRMERDTRVCAYSTWQHFVKWLTRCLVCVHHPTLQMYTEAPLLP